jgi:hypothetical protein
MRGQNKNAIIYKGHLVMSQENAPDGAPYPALRPSSYFIEREENYQQPHLTGLTETPDIRLKEGHILYVVAENREEITPDQPKASDTLYGVLELFQQGKHPKVSDTKSLAFRSRIAAEHYPQLQAFSENLVHALLYCPARPEYHLRQPGL